MNKLELKKNFHKLIDSLESEHLLIIFYDLIKSRSDIKDGQLWNNLNLEEQEQLIKAFKESETPGNLIDHSDMKKKHGKWL